MLFKFVFRLVWLLIVVACLGTGIYQMIHQQGGLIYFGGAGFSLVIGICFYQIFKLMGGFED